MDTSHPHGSSFAMVQSEIDDRIAEELKDKVAQITRAIEQPFEQRIDQSFRLLVGFCAGVILTIGVLTDHFQAALILGLIIGTAINTLLIEGPIEKEKRRAIEESFELKQIRKQLASIKSAAS